MFPNRLTLSPEALFQEIGGEGVILDLASANYFGLDEVGVRFWQLLQTGSSVEDACATLLEEFHVEPSQLREDLSRFIDQLLAAGLVAVG